MAPAFSLYSFVAAFLICLPQLAPADPADFSSYLRPLHPGDKVTPDQIRMQVAFDSNLKRLQTTSANFNLPIYARWTNHGKTGVKLYLSNADKDLPGVLWGFEGRIRDFDKIFPKDRVLTPREGWYTCTAYISVGTIDEFPESHMVALLPGEAVTCQIPLASIVLQGYGAPTCPPGDYTLETRLYDIYSEHPLTIHLTKAP